MQDFREHVAISIDGGGIKGLIVAKALQILEEHLDQSLHDTFRLTAGTSTGAIIAAGLDSSQSVQASKKTPLRQRGLQPFPTCLLERPHCFPTGDAGQLRHRWEPQPPGFRW